MDLFGGNEKQEPKLEELSAMLEDFNHFESTFLPPIPFDPNNNNEYVDLSEIFGPEMDKEEENTADRPVHCDHNIQGLRVRYFTTRTNVGTQFGNKGRNWAPRRRGRVSKKDTSSKAERLLKGRIASREWYEKKKAQSLQMEAEMKRLREENAALKKLLQPQPGRRQLQRTVSAPI